jgi:glycosyltransferase involved in cell wall biosynthesis
MHQPQMREKRFVQVGVRLDPSSGGTYTSAKNFNIALHELGILADVVSVSAAADGNLAAVLCRPTPIPMSGLFGWCRGGELRKLTRAVETADGLIIHGLYFHAASVAAELARRRGIPAVIVLHGGLDPYVFKYRWLRKRVWLRLHRDALFERSQVVCATRGEFRKAQAFVKPENLRVIGWPVQAHAALDKTAARAQIRRKHGISPAAEMTLFCGRIHSIKRPFETVSAFLRARLPNWVLVVVGPAEDRAEADRLRAMADASEGRCLYAGAVYEPELSAYYRAADAFVSFSRKENFGYSIVEAAGFGVPVLVTSEVDLGEDIAERGCGVVVRDTSSEGLVQAFRTLHQIGRGQRLAMGERARTWVEQCFSFDHFRSGVADLVQAAG